MGTKDPSSQPLSRNPSARPHSVSLSSVHFADLPHRQSIASIRSLIARPPSQLNISTIPSSSDDLPTPPIHVESTAPALNGLTNGHPSPYTSRGIPVEKAPSFPPSLQPLQDHRVRSEGIPAIPNGKRASLMTGGYETSSDDGDAPVEKGHSRLPTAPTPTNVGLGIRTQSDQGRRRARTLMPPVDTPGGDVSELGMEARKVRRLEGSRRSSRDPLRSPTSSHPPSRISSQRSTRSGLPTSRSDSYFAHPPSHVPSAAGPSRSASSRRQDEVSSPDGSRKGKGKERGDGLMASLGLDGGPRDVALSPEQINDLINDSDIASALRMMSSNHLTGQRVPFYPTNPSISSFSPSNTRPGSPAAPIPRTEPFLVSAPPALTGPDGRDRAISISSTVAQSPRDGRARTSVDSTGEVSARRRRASSHISRAYVEGGHVPFTHHVPVVTVDEDESVDDIPEAPIEERRESVIPSPGKGVEKRGRISSLFHRKSNKEETPVPSPGHQTREDHVREKVKQEREVEMRKKELERREAELLQERRFRALTQVTAHPESERMAYRTSSHLRAFYNNVYDGVDNPPKVNPLAVLRWRGRTDEQAEAKRKWEAQHPAALTFGAMHSSPISLGAPPRQESETSSVGESKRDPPGPAKAWRYTVEDVATYKACSGVVNYFIAPRDPIEDAPRSESTRDDGRSTVDSTKKVDIPTQARVTSVAPGESPDVSVAPLSRSVSNDTGGYRAAPRQYPHVQHGQSSSITNAMKMPFEKLGSAARKRSIFSPHDEADDSQFESPSSHHVGYLPKRPARASTTPDPAHVHHHHIFRRGDKAGSGTDEEGRHVRKLFLKGQRTSPLDEVRIMRRSDVSEAARAEQRQSELRHLETALARESAFRARQAEIDRRTQLEADTRERIDQIEREIYQERKQQAMATRTRLEVVDSNLERIDDSFRHYLAQIEQVRTVAKVSADVETVWPDVDTLKRSFSVEGGESTGEFVRNTPRRKSTLSTPLPSLFNFGIKPWPRRATLESDGITRVDPVRRVELTIDRARSQRETMGRRRVGVTRELQSMIGRIDALIRQKDAVRSWTKAASEQNRSLQHAVDTLHRQIRGDSRARMGRMKDRVYDTLVRRLLSPLFRGVFGVFYMGRWVWGLRSPHGRVESVRGLRGAPWRVWGSGAVIVGLVAFFYFIGG